MSIEKSSFVLHFSPLEDPRIERSKKHLLIEIVAITVIGCLCGIDSFEGIAVFAEERLEWLKQFLRLAGGAPSHDTFSRVFARNKPEKFRARSSGTCRQEKPPTLPAKENNSMDCRQSFRLEERAA